MKRIKMLMIVTNLFFIFMNASSISILYADNRTLIGTECGPMHIVSHGDKGLIPTTHNTFTANNMFLGDLILGEFDYN